MARPALGAFRSTPQGILAAESGLTPAQALLYHRQARFAQRLHARPQDDGGPEEILDQGGAAITERLRAAAGTKRGETVEPQVWNEGRVFSRERRIAPEGPALGAAQNWQIRDTIWTDGSRLDNGKVRATCAWQTHKG